MEFEIRKVCNYLNIEVKIDNTTIDMGLQDDTELESLLIDLESAVSSIKEHLNNIR